MKNERFKLGYRRDQWVVVDEFCKAVVECGQFEKADLCKDMLNAHAVTASNFLWKSQVDGKTL